MKIMKLVAKIIPPDNYQHRNGFTNTELINRLTKHEKELVENELIKMLLDKTDLMIVETLAYMKSEKSLFILNNLLEQCSDDMIKIIISSSIFEINKDENMICISINAFKGLDDMYQKISAFYYLRKFDNTNTDNLIEEYTNHSEYLLSYNAKKALNK